MLVIKSIHESLKEDYKKGASIEEIAKELYKAGFFNYIPDPKQVKKWLKIEE